MTALFRAELAFPQHLCIAQEIHLSPPRHRRYLFISASTDAYATAQLVILHLHTLFYISADSIRARVLTARFIRLSFRLADGHFGSWRLRLACLLPPALGAE